ncbi:MAG: hypothetical protein HQM10_08090 [Candidatus Riflebacteria bacterium]|nr:hypothetical protein [Candidatus Riflebacteria bacterium]
MNTKINNNNSSLVLKRILAALLVLYIPLVLGCSKGKIDPAIFCFQPGNPSESVQLQYTLKKVVGTTSDFSSIPSGYTVEGNYVISSIPINSREQLIQELTPDGKEKSLSDAAKSVLAYYDCKDSSAMKDRLSFAYKANSGKLKRNNNIIPIEIYETSGVKSNVSRDTLISDFWPCGGTGVRLNDLHHERDRGKCSDLLAHEISHVIHQYPGGGYYGPDGRHFKNEALNMKTAFIEGWAVFNELVENPGKALEVWKNIDNIKIEDPVQAGKYTSVKRSSLSGMRQLEIEGVVALVLLGICKNFPDGYHKMIQPAFAAVNPSYPLLPELLREILKNQPDSKDGIIKIINEVTLGKFSSEDFANLIAVPDGSGTSKSQNIAASYQGSSEINSKMNSQTNAVPKTNVLKDSKNMFMGHPDNEDLN